MFSRRLHRVWEGLECSVSRLEISPLPLREPGQVSIFQTAQWDTFTSNNMVGPEFGMMFEGSQGAWDWYAGGSFTAGFNWQNNIYKGANLPQNLGADYLRTNFAGGGVTTVNFSSPAAGNDSTSVVSVPTSPLIVQVFPTGQSAATNSAEHRFTFSPIGEWRFGGRYRISKGISLNFGYTGMWLSQIARASSNTKFVQKVKLNPAVARNQTAQRLKIISCNQPWTDCGCKCRRFRDRLPK